MLVISDNSHPLTKRVTQRLEESLGINKLVENVTFAAASTPVMAEGSAAPDLFLRLQLKDYKSEGLVSKRTEVVFRASLGSTPWQSNHYTHDSTTPPAVSFTWDSTINIESKFKGIRSDPYDTLAKIISEEITKGISNRIVELGSKFPPLKELNSVFYGPYEAVQDPAFVKKFNAQRIMSYYDLLSHNRTYWSVPLDQQTSQFSQLVKDIESEGWKPYNLSTNAGISHVEFRNGETTLEVFPVRREKDEIQTKPAHGEFVVAYRKPFSRAEREAAVATLLGEGAELETALTFENQFSPEQRAEFYRLAEQAKTPSPQLCLRLADRFLSRADTNRARPMLLRAKALRVTLSDRSGFDPEIEKLAKRISPKQQASLQVTPEVCREAGFMEITNTQEEMVVEGEIGRPLLLFGTGESGLELISITLRRVSGQSGEWTIAQLRDDSESRAQAHADLIDGRKIAHSVSLGKNSRQVQTELLPGGRKVRYKISPGQN